MMASLEVLPLHLSTVTFPDFHPLAGQTGDVLGFAVRHATGVALFDTGIGDGSSLIDRYYEPVRRSLADALAAHGHELADVTDVVNSHLHFDHCGNNPLLPGIPIFVQEVELAAARTEPHYTVPDWVDFPGAEYRVLDGETMVRPGIRIITTPGHTRGHQSVVLDDGHDRPVVLAGQAIYTRAEYEHVAAHGTPLPLGDDIPPPDPTSVASAQRLIDLRPRRVHFSHDVDVWTDD